MREPARACSSLIRSGLPYLPSFTPCPISIVHVYRTCYHPHPSGNSAGYEGLKNAFGILNQNILMNLSDTGVSPAKLAVVCLIAAVLAVDIAVLWLISRNTLAEARTFFKDNFYFKRIRLVYPTPVPKENTPKQKLKHLFQHIREEGKQKLQNSLDPSGSGYGYGLDSAYDGTGTSATSYDSTGASASAPEYVGKPNKLFGNVLDNSVSGSAPDYGYVEKEKTKNSLFGNLFSNPAKPSWNPVSGPSSSGSGSGPTPSPSSSSSFYPTSSSPAFLDSYATQADSGVRKAKSIAEQAVDTVSKAGNHLFGKVFGKATSSELATSASSYAPDFVSSASAYAPDYFGSVLDKLSTATR